MVQSVFSGVRNKEKKKLVQTQENVANENEIPSEPINTREMA